MPYITYFGPFFDHAKIPMILHHTETLIVMAPILATETHIRAAAVIVPVSSSFLAFTLVAVTLHARLLAFRVLRLLMHCAVWLLPRHDCSFC